MKISTNKGTTFIEIIACTVILLFTFQLVLNLFLYQKKFSSENYLKGEYQRQLHFAESYLKRDLYESKIGRKKSPGILELTNYSGRVISYYLAVDPYGNESWKGKSVSTLYRKITGENAQPLTQYCESFLVEEIVEEKVTKVKAELTGGKRKIIIEEYYEDKQ